MRLILFLILFSLVACAPSSPDDSPRERMNKRMSKRTNKQGRQARQQQGKEQPPKSEKTTKPTKIPGTNRYRLAFPVQVEGENNIQMDIESKENNTKVTIRTNPEEESLNILAGFDGTVYSENPRRIILTNDNWELIFDLEEDVSLAKEPNTPVTAEEVLASTTGPITFSLKEKGNPVRFCLNLINQSEGLVDVQILNSEGQCKI